MRLADLQKTLGAADPAAVLVSPRILERVIREDCDLPNMYWNIPHAKSYVCDRHQLFRHAEQADLELEPDQVLPDTVILLVHPDAEELNNLERTMVLLKYWRRLFHSRVHLALASLTPDGVQDRIAEIGRTEFEEIRTVLREDAYLPPEADDRTTWIEFAAVFLEMSKFASNLLPNYFPGIRDFGKVERLLGRDVDIEQLFVGTRLKDAPDPVIPNDPRSDDSQEAYWKLVRSAQRAALDDNTVGAAILRMRASRIAPAALTLPTRNEAEEDITHLTKRLAEALTLSDAERVEWTRLLILLLDKADQGARPMEARVLEDLQKVCLDHERDVYTLDLVEYITSAGKRPIKRQLPSQRLVRIAKHLHAAAQKLGEVRLSDTDRSHLARLLQGSLNKSEQALRARFGPILVTAMEDVGLWPRNPIEKAAFEKMVGELLDRITSYGFLTFAELRDTISRNQLKFADLREPEDFIRGDPLIRLDRRLGALLDGVYRPSEFYTRWLERGMSLLFGTPWGRGLSRNVLLPLACAWLTLNLCGLLLKSFFHYPKYPWISWIAQVLVGPIQHSYPAASTYEIGMDVVGGMAVPRTGPLGTLVMTAFKIDRKIYGEVPPPSPHWLWHVSVLLPVTILAMALIRSKDLRQRCLRALVTAGQSLHLVFWQVPRRYLPIDAIRRFLSTWFFQLLYLYVIQPGLLTSILILAFPQLRTLWYTGGVFILALLLLTSRVGRTMNEAVQDALISLGNMVRVGLIPGLIRFFIRLFKQVVESIEYVLFVVDEWLRFRSGAGRTSLVVRTILGVIWYPIAFLVRFYMVVLVEPFLNPIKLPLSILAAKFVYPMLAILGWFEIRSLNSPLTGYLAPYLSQPIAWVVVVTTFYLLPDAVAFLVWEMKENWSLYRANRGKVLRPVVVGAHGETVRGLLQPGFHSGTVPRLYARLRHAERIATKTRNWHNARAYRHEVEAMKETLNKFISREMVALLNQSRAWQGHHVATGPVHLSTNRMGFELIHSDHPVKPVEIEIEQSNGWLVAGVCANGWLEDVGEPQRRAFCLCLAGLYKGADVDLVREQLEASLPGPVASFQLDRESLRVWTDLHGEPRSYRLREDPENPAATADLHYLLFSRTPILWEQWIQCWEKDQAGEGQPELPIRGELLVRLHGSTSDGKLAARGEAHHVEETTQPRPEAQGQAGPASEEAPRAEPLPGVQGEQVQDR
jgi:hypothetical protein